MRHSKGNPVRDLLKAIETDDVKAARDAVERGAFVNQVVEDQPVLATAVAAKAFATAQMLIERGAKVNFLDREGGSLLYRLAAAGHLPLLDQAIRSGFTARHLADYGPGALLAACATHERTDIVERLLDLGVNPNVMSPSGCMALGAAAMKNRAGTVRLLLERGADIEKGSAENMSGLGLMLALLISANKPVGQQPCTWMTPLLMAVEEGAEEAAEYLIAAGANVHARMPSGINALGLVSLRRAPRLARRLLQLGVAPSEHMSHVTRLVEGLEAGNDRWIEAELVERKELLDVFEDDIRARIAQCPLEELSRYEPLDDRLAQSCIARRMHETANALPGAIIPKRQRPEGVL